MKKKDLKIISLQFRTLSSQMLKITAIEESNYIRMFYDFIRDTPLIFGYIESCNKTAYDFDEIVSSKSWTDALTLPSSEEGLVYYGYKLIEYILENPNRLVDLGMAYTKSNKFSDIIPAFMRKAVEPFVVAIRSFLEINFIDCEDKAEENRSETKTIFLSYCHKDTDITNIIENKLKEQLEGKAVISRDIRDVEYHGSFKRFMQTIGEHDYVLSIISDN